MSDAVQPAAAEVRAAAEALKAAIDRHLTAVEGRSGENDPRVTDAFEALAAAAEAYDEVLYDVHDEVTPFEIPGSDQLPAYAGPDEPRGLSVLIRRDYAVVDTHRLLAQAQRIAELDPDVDTGAATDDPAGVVGSSLTAAVGVLFGEYEPDEIASRHLEFGLAEGDSTVWVVAEEEPSEPGEWLSAPFDQADPEQVICRFDVSAAFDEELELSDDDEDDEVDLLDDDELETIDNRP
ncbi:hypothetical protein SRB5_34090 [Streptomyces sp. RB5]|uniref:Uncharacterized protein n=1 Tax=Streptomyces smaragdinus TaxID=2585196 RepID=A0A7K0CIF9_9ACTN|nr:hypothetical protein [Streptomyces smaragdinus]MQY13265.1 hypothetical protein [Streptomyces smaragdinus]